MTTSISLQIAQATGLLGAVWLSGNIATLSLNSIPALTASQSRDSLSSRTLARQWKSMYTIGKTQNPPIAVVAATSFSYLAWTLRSLPGKESKLYGVAALLTVGIVPWTILAMSTTNSNLMAVAGKEAEEKVDEEEVRNLLNKWGILNGIRSLLPLVGGAVGIWAILL